MMSMLCRVVTRFRARRGAARVEATVLQATPRTTSQEVVTPTAPETEVEAGGRPVTPEPSSAKGGPPVVQVEGSIEDYSKHVSILSSAALYLVISSGARQRSRWE